jgi:hypothetical protein
VVDGGGDHGRRVGGDVDPAVGEVGVDGRGDAAVAQVAQRRLFPGRVLAAIDGQLGGRTGVVGGVGEASAGADLGELTVVPDEQHAAASAELGGNGGLKGADVGHAGLVDDQRTAGPRRVEPAAPVIEQPVEGA